MFSIVLILLSVPIMQQGELNVGHLAEPEPRVHL